MYLTDVQTTANYGSLKYVPWKLHSLRHSGHVVDGKLSVLQPERNSWREGVRRGRGQRGGKGRRREEGRKGRQEDREEGRKCERERKRYMKMRMEYMHE